MFRIKASIFFSVFVAMLSLMLISPIMPPLIRELGLSESHSGWIISLGSVWMAIMAPIWGRRSDTRGRKPIILTGFIGMGVSCLLFALALYSGLKGWIAGGMLVALLIVTRSMIGLFIPAVLSSAQAYMGDVTEGQERTAGMAIISAANGMGLVFGPAIAGAFTGIGLLWPLYFGTALSFVAFVAALLFIPPAKPIMQEKPPKVNPFQSGLRLYLLAGFVTMTAVIGIQVVGGFYFQDMLHLTGQETARMLSVGLMLAGVAMLLVQVVQMKWMKLQPKTMMLVGSLFILLGMLIFLYSESKAYYYLAFFLFGVGAGMSMPGFMAAASLSVSKEQQGGVAGLIASVQGITAIVTPIVTTTLYQADKSLPFWLIIALSAAIVPVLLFVKGRASAKPSANEGLARE
ncbi:MFS transporter [Cohnella sp. LGH]|uniref:MFS transporter n=1 Tax=Cohnella sp. LGH TaxID=1619153 RepID=UPI001ADD0E15|nr:MFS transporter [Cohnella sp. LGH]QTH45695.1 MFS transporter [Cohnella sp. LGH]